MNSYERARRRFPKYLVVAFVSIVALAFIIGAALQFINRQHIYKNGIEAIGTVHEIEHVTNTDTDILAFKVKFNYNNQDYLIENENKSIDARYELNEKLKVRFIADSPEKAIIADAREQEYTSGLLPAIIGLVVLGFIVYVARKDSDFNLRFLQKSKT